MAYFSNSSAAGVRTFESNYRHGISAASPSRSSSSSSLVTSSMGGGMGMGGMGMGMGGRPSTTSSSARMGGGALTTLAPMSVSSMSSVVDTTYVNILVGDMNEAHTRIEEAERKATFALRRKEIQLTEQLRAAESQLEQIKIQKDNEYEMRMEEKRVEIERLRAELASNTEAEEHQRHMSELDAQIEGLKHAIAKEKAQRMTLELDLDGRRNHIRSLTEQLKTTEHQFRHDQRVLALFRDAHIDVSEKVDKFNATHAASSSSTTTSYTSSSSSSHSATVASSSAAVKSSSSSPYMASSSSSSYSNGDSSFSLKNNEGHVSPPRLPL